MYVMYYNVTHTWRHVFLCHSTNGVGVAVDCAMFIQSQRSGALGENPVCSWSADGLALSVLFGKAATITVGDGLYFLAGTVKSLNGISSTNQRRAAGDLPSKGIVITIASPSVVMPPM